MFKLKFSTDNAAFENGPEEITRILQSISEHVANYETCGLVYDINGNKVGAWSY